MYCVEPFDDASSSTTVTGNVCETCQHYLCACGCMGRCLRYPPVLMRSILPWRTKWEYPSVHDDSPACAEYRGQTFTKYEIHQEKKHED